MSSVSVGDIFACARRDPSRRPAAGRRAVPTGALRAGAAGGRVQAAAAADQRLCRLGWMERRAARGGLGNVSPGGWAPCPVSGQRMGSEAGCYLVG